MNHLNQLLFEDVGPTRRGRVLPQAKTGSPLESGILRRQIAGVLQRQIMGEVRGGGRSSGNCALKWYGLVWSELLGLRRRSIVRRRSLTGGAKLGSNRRASIWLTLTYPTISKNQYLAYPPSPLTRGCYT